MKMRLKSALNMPNLNGTLNLFAKHCVYILSKGGGRCGVAGVVVVPHYSFALAALAKFA